MIPNEILDKGLKELRGNEYAVLIHLYRRTSGWQKDICEFSINKFSKEYHYSRNTVSNIIHTLEEKKYIEIYHKNNNNINIKINTLAQNINKGCSKIEQGVAQKISKQNPVNVMLLN